MGSELVAQEWELIVSSDFASTLIPRGQLRRLQRPVDVRMLPGGAYCALEHSVGRQTLGDLLLVPAVVRPVGHLWRRRRRYAPMCVLGIGEHGLGLWVEATPSPRVQMVLPFGDIAAIERRADGPWRRLTVTGRDARFCLWYDADGDASADIWTRRLRQRATGLSRTLPAGSRAVRSRLAAVHSVRPLTVRPFLINPDEDAVVVSGRSLVGGGSCLLAVTAREIIVVNTRGVLTRPWHGTTRALYVPRASVTGAVVASGSLRLRSAGTEVSAGLRLKAVAAAASRWLASPAVQDAREHAVKDRVRQRA